MASCCTATAQADAPIFTESSYSFDVSLDQMSSFVGLVQAFDPEWDNFGYILHDSSGLFSINPLFGYINADMGELEPGTYTMTVEANDIFDESSFVEVEVVVEAGPPPVITNVNFVRMAGNMWVITGMVDSSTPGGTVKFGGLLNGKSVQYQQFGSFTLWTSINGIGDVSMQAIDQDGQTSDIVHHAIQ